MHNDTINPNLFIINTTFVAKNAPDCMIRLFANPDGPGCVLEWGDVVSNEFREEFNNLSSALARVALLAYCGSTDWDATFANSSGVFSSEWLEFAKKSTF